MVAAAPGATLSQTPALVPAGGPAHRTMLSIVRKTLGTLSDAFLKAPTALPPQGPLGAPSHLKGQ